MQSSDRSHRVILVKLQQHDIMQDFKIQEKPRLVRVVKIRAKVRSYLLKMNCE